MSHWTILPLTGELGEHASAWDALLRRLFNANPMLDSRFISALLEHFGDGTEHIGILRANEEIQAMCVLKKRGPGIWTTFLPSQAQIGPALMKGPQELSGLFGALPGVTGQIDFLCNDPAFGDMRQTDPRILSSQDHALTISVSLMGTFDSYWSSRSRNLSHNISRYERRLVSDTIPTRFVCVQEASHLEAAVMRYAALESQGWKGKLGTAVAADNAQGAFYADIVKRFGKSGQSIVFELWFGGQLAASLIAIIVAKTMVLLKTSYDESLNKYAPGRLLLRDVIRHGFHTYPLGMIEFYTNANGEKLGWATHQRWIKHISVYRSVRAANALLLLRATRQLVPVRKAPSVVAIAPTQAEYSVDFVAHPGQLPSDVKNLFTLAEATSMESSATWYSNLVDTVYKHDAGVRFYVLRRKGVPVAVLPVRLLPGRFGNGVEALANYYTALYTPALAVDLRAPELVQLLQSMMRTLAPLSQVRLAPMDPHSDAYLKLMDAMRSAGLLSFHFFCFGNWHLPVREGWAAYLASRQGPLRNSIKRHGKKLANEGGHLQLIDGGEALEAAISAYQRVYAASWKNEEPFPDFMPGLIRTCAAQGSLRMGVAWLKDEPIAAQVWIVQHHKADIYKLAYHQDYKEYAPGTLLTAMLFQHVVENDHVQEIDYLIGDDPYKTTWMSRRRERWGIIAYNPHTLGGVFGLGREIVGGALRPVLLAVESLRNSAAKQWMRLRAQVTRN